jgi:hypothetical protein
MTQQTPAVRKAYRCRDKQFPRGCKVSPRVGKRIPCE